MKKVAVIGLGKMGLLHTSLLNTIPGVKVAALCEKSRLIYHFASKMIPGSQMIRDIEELKRFELDAVYVTTPPSSHFHIVKYLLVSNICKNIFVEKPLADNPKDSETLTNLARVSGLHIDMVGYNRRFGVTFRKAKSLMEEGILGDLSSFRGYALSSDFYQAVDRNKGAGRGGVIKDLGCHAIDLVLWYVGNLTIKKIDDSKLTLDGYVDAVEFQVTAAGNIDGTIQASWIEPNHRLPDIGFMATGTKGISLLVNEDKLELNEQNGKKSVWYKHDLEDRAGFLLGGTDYWREDSVFIDSIISGQRVESNFVSASRVDSLIQQIETQIAG